MKRKFLPILILSLASLTSCGKPGSSVNPLFPTSSSVAPSTPEPSTPVASTPVVSTSAPSTPAVSYSTVADIRAAEVDSEHTVRGVVVKHVYTGQSTPYITGFMLANESGCIYIYGENTAKSVEVGDTVVVKGYKAYYVPQTDTGAAASTGYKGQLQLARPDLISKESTHSEIPESIITPIERVNEVVRHALDDDISNQLYRMIGRIRKIEGGDFINYYLDDLNRVDTINFYTQSNGKDYTWLNEYVGKVVDMTFIAINAKPGTGLWRGLPVKVNGEASVTDKQEAEFAAIRGLDVLLDSYGETVSVDAPKTDERLEGVTLKYESTSSCVSIEEKEDKYVIAINVGNPTTATITVTATYEGESASEDKVISLGVVPEYTAITIAEAREKETGEEVTIEGIVARRTYKSGTNDPLGAFIVDETGSVVIYNNTEYMASLADAVEGNKVVLKGTVDRYISSNTQNSEYTGDLQIKNTELIYNDGGKHEIPADAIEEKPLTFISSNPISNNISGIIYKMTAVVIRNSGMYLSYSLGDPESDAKLSVYSQKSGSDFAWLDEYDGKTVVLYVGVQNLQLKSGNPNWRCCPIQILSIVE